MRAAILVVLMSFVLAGCAGPGAVLIESPKTSLSNYAPLNEAGKLGSVKYRLSRHEGKNKQSREAAYEKMYRSCNGPYEITGETPSKISKYDPGYGPYDPGGTVIINENTIDFKCVR